MQAARKEEAAQAARAVAGRAASGPGAGANGAAKSGLQPLQQKLQQHIDREDRRIKELTEAILYDFLPRALRAAAGGDDIPRELTPQKCRAVAGAALAVAALMNAPPGFLEFLLCVPWGTLGSLYPCPFDPSGSSSAPGPDGAPVPAPALYFDWAPTSVGLGVDGGMGSPGGGGGAAARPGTNSTSPATAGMPVPQLEASSEERAAIVNLQLDPGLMDCMLDFLLRDEHAESLPPMMRLAAGESEADPTVVTRETVAALLDGATSLHCAAIRGNPAQVDHLLLCGADPLITNAAGEMPVENIPVCGDRCIAGKLSCRCMALRDQEAWECRSRLARTLILRRCVVSWGRHGFGAWLRVVVLCLLCLLGLWGHHTTLKRPALEAQAAARRERRRQAALQRAQGTLLKMRTNVSSARELLQSAGAGEESEDAQLDPGEAESGGGSTHSGGAAASAQQAHGAGGAGSLLGSQVCEGGEEGGSYRLMLGGGGGSKEACRGGRGAFDKAERAYGCFTAAVDLLQTLELHGGVVPKGVQEVGGADSPAFQVNEEEQAAIYAGWAEAALLKFRACSCAGCASLALHTAMASHRQLAALFATLERRRAGAAKGPGRARLRPRGRTAKLGVSGGEAAGVPASDDEASPAGSGRLSTKREGKGAADGADSWQRVGACLASVVHVSMCVLLGTDVRQSATRAGVWRAQQCLQEWGRLRGLGLMDALGSDECLEAECLEGWCRAAAADLVLAEALRGAAVAPRTPLAEVLPLAVQYDLATGLPSLNRPVSREVVLQLTEALELARPYASEHVLRVADAVARQMQDEIAAGEQLRELLQPRGVGGAGGGGGGTSGAALAEQLSEAIEAAERFPNLQAELEQARGLRERWIKRAEAQAQLDAVIDEVAGPAPEGLLCRPGPGGGPPEVDAEAFWRELNARLGRLEAAAEAARQANIGVSRAKRVLKELAGQGAAVEAAAKLDEALAGDKGGSSAIKSALAKAEAALAAAPGGTAAACGFQLGVELLAPRIQAARQKLEVERAAEGLVRAVATCKGVGDLPRLEAAILAGRKLGAQGMHPEAYRAASDLRGRLEAASRARSTLDAALRNLQKMGRQEDADAVERAAEEAGACGDLLAAECARAREAVHRWRTAAASEAKLERALREGAGTAQLSRVIKEAAASGVKVGEARRLLKVMQGLEAAVQSAVEGPFQYLALKSKIESAEAGGAPPGLVASARATMQCLLLREVRAELHAVLKAASTKTDKSVTQRLSSLKSVLEKADTVLLMERELAQQAQHAQRGDAAGSPRHGSASVQSPSAASQSVQEKGDVWEEATATSVTSGGRADAGDAGGPAAEGQREEQQAAAAAGGEGEGEQERPFAAPEAQQGLDAQPAALEESGGEGRPGSAAASAAPSATPGLSRTGTGVSQDGAASEGMGPEDAPEDPSAYLSATTSLAGEAGQDGGGTGAETAAAAATVAAAAASAEQGAESSSEAAGAAAAPAGPRQLSVVVPPSAASRPHSAASTPSAAYSTPAESPDSEQLSPRGPGGEDTGGEGLAEEQAEAAEADAAESETGPEAAAPESGPGAEPEPGATSASEDEVEGGEEEEGDLAAVMRLVRRARRQLAREEAEQERIERERAEEARARREAQAQLKAEREKADKERAERAKAERAERRAAQEAAKAERRERERQARLEKEREREVRERAAREHFAALQRQRRVAAQAQAQAVQTALLASPVQPQASPRQAGPGGLLLASPRSALAPHPPPQLPPHAAAMLDAAELAQHARHDSLEMLSVRTGLLELLGEGDTGRTLPEDSLPGTRQPLHSSETSLLSPTSTATSGVEGWEPTSAPAPTTMEGTLLGAGGVAAAPRWPSGDNATSALGTSCTGSEASLSATLLSPEWSPARASQPAGRIRFSDLGGASWLAEGGTGPGELAGGAPTSSALLAPPATAAPPAGTMGLGLGGGGTLWSGHSMDSGGGSVGVAGLPAQLQALSGGTRDDLALLSHQGSDAASIWQAAAGDGWGGGGLLSGAGTMASPARGGAAAGAGGVPPGGLTQQQQRQQQLLAAIDAAKAQVQLSQQAAAAAAVQAVQQGGRVCKYFLQGFCREGTKCRYVHPAGGAVAAQQQLAGSGGSGVPGQVSPRLAGSGGSLGQEALAAYATGRMGVPALLGGAGGQAQGAAGQLPMSLPMVGMAGGGGLQPGEPGGSAGGAVSSFAFGAPGSLAFNSAPVSRSPTPSATATPLGGLGLPPSSTPPPAGSYGSSAAAPYSPTRLARTGGSGSGLDALFNSPRGGQMQLPGDAGGGAGAGGGLLSHRLSTATLSDSSSSGGGGGQPRSLGADAGSSISPTAAAAAAALPPGSPDPAERDHYGLPSEASLFSGLVAGGPRPLGGGGGAGPPLELHGLPDGFC